MAVITTWVLLLGGAALAIQLFTLMRTQVQLSRTQIKWLTLRIESELSDREAMPTVSKENRGSARG
jgi:hypothetical protein